MALTLTRNPGAYLPAYNDMTYLVNSTNTAQTNFYIKIYLDYYDDGAANFVNVFEGKIYPLPDQTYARFDPSYILRDFVSNDFLILKNGVTTGQRSSSGEQYRIRFREYYGAPPTAQGSELTQTNFVFNAAFDRREYTRFSQDDYVINATSLARFLTPVDTIWLRESDSYLLTLMSKATGGTALFTKLNYERFNVSGVSIGTGSISMLSPEADVRNLFQSVLAGPAQVGVTSETEYYEIWAASAADVQRTEKLRVYIDRACYKYEMQKIYWLNRLGGIDSFNLPLVSRFSVETSRKTYNRPVGQALSSSNWSLNSYDSERTPYSIKTKNKMVLNTDILNDTQAVMLRDLMTSGLIWWYDATNDEYAFMQLDRNDFEVKQSINDGAYQEEITLYESLENERQRC